MCGIVGFNFSNKELLERMKKSIFYRGPDSNGSYIDELVSLGHVRLSIIDLTPLANQPMEFKDLVLVYNGEIYNYKEIKKELQKEGYKFISNSDSEVVVKAFHKWGVECVKKFRGMFAFCIYDKKEKKFYLFRDRVGVKPLYYYFDGKNFVFASEVRAILQFKKLSINKISLAQFFHFGYINEGSIFENVFKLSPGSFLEFNLKSGSLKESKYWDLEVKEENIDEKEALDRLEEILIESFKLRMVSDVDVGVFLSGGVDSSLVAAILQKYYGNIKTFTIGFYENRYDESIYARRVANYIGSEHKEFKLTANRAREILEFFVDIYDEPFGDSSGIPTYLISKLAKENGVKVVLSADGGDELFGGYDRYFFSYKLGWLKDVWFKEVFYKLINKVENVLLYFPIKNMEHKIGFLKRLLKSDSWFEVYDTIIKQYRDDIKFLGLNEIKIGKSFFDKGEIIHPIVGMMVWDFFNYLPNDILVKVDRASMYNSIEAREPFLDHKIIEYAFRLPFNLKVKNNQGKYILKRLLLKYLPKELVYRKKMGFGIPIFEWFRRDLIKLFDDYFYEDDIVDMSYPRKLLMDFKSGKYVNINKLWFVLVYKMWKERYVSSSYRIS